MALNKSVETGSLGRRTGNAMTRASGIPSATRIAKSSENSSDSSIKLRTLQSSDGKTTTDIAPPRQRSLGGDRATTPGRNFGGGGETDSKQSIKSIASTAYGVAKSQGKADQKLDRNASRISGVTDVNSIVPSDVHCKLESTSKVTHPSSLPLAVSSYSKADRSNTKAPADHQKTGAVVGASVGKRSSPGSSVGSKVAMQTIASKAKSPSLSSRIASEAGGKTDAHVRKTTGIAKLQNPQTSVRPLGSTSSRTRPSPCGSSIPSSRALPSSRPTVFNEFSGNIGTRGGDKPGRKTGFRLDNSSGGTSGGSRTVHSTLKIPKSHALNNGSLKKNSIQELKSVIPSSQDTIGKNFDDAVENTSEFEYFSETKSNMSENTSDLGDDAVSLDLNVSDLETERLSELRESLEASTAQLIASTEDIFTSCEDIMCATTHDYEEMSRNSNVVNDFKSSSMLNDNNDVCDYKLNQKSEIYITDTNSSRENETEHFIEEDTLTDQLQIVEEEQFIAAVESGNPDFTENSADNIPDATNNANIVLRSNGNNNEVTSNCNMTTDSDNTFEHRELEETEVSSCSNSMNSPSDEDKQDFGMNSETDKASNEIKVSTNDCFNSSTNESDSDAVSMISDAERSQNVENIGSNSFGEDLQIEDTISSDSRTEEAVAALSPDTGQCTSDDSIENCQGDHSISSSCVIIDGLGADGTEDCEGETSSGCSVTTKVDFLGTLPANSGASSGGEGEGSDEADKDRGQSSGIARSDSCETLICPCENDVEADASSSKDGDESSAAGIHDCTAVNNENKSEQFAKEITDGCMAKRPKLLGDETVSDQEIEVSVNPSCKDSFCDTDVKMSEDVCVETLLLHPEKMLNGKSSECVTGERRQDVDEDGLLLSTHPDLNLSHDNYADICRDVKPAVKVQNNSTPCLRAKQYTDGDDTGQLSACFIKEFSAWLPGSDCESRLKRVYGNKFGELSDDVCNQIRDSKGLDEQDLFDFNMDRKSYHRLDVSFKTDGSEFAGKETYSGRKLEIHSREKFDSSHGTDSVGEEVSSTQVTPYTHESSSSTRTEFSLANRPRSQCSTIVSDSVTPITSSATPVEQKCIAGNSVTHSSVDSISSDNNGTGNQSPKHVDKSNETLVNQDSNRDSVKDVVHPTESSANSTRSSAKCKTVVEEEETCTGSSDAASPAETEKSKVDDLETKSALNSSIQLSFGGLCFGSSAAKELDRLMHRAPSPLTVLTDPCHSAGNDKDAHSSNFSNRKPTVPSEIPRLDVRRFGPISANSSDSQNGVQQNSEVATELQSDPNKVIKDANHNVVGKTGIVSTNTDSDRAVSSEIHEFMSPQYVPSRPLSQICTRTMGKSLHRNTDGSNNSSLTSVESLPAVDSGESEGKANVLAQIHIARSCGRTGLVKSPSMTQSENLMTQSCSTPIRLPVAGSLPSFGSSGTALKSGMPSSLSRASASRHSICSTPVAGEGSLPRPASARASMFEFSSRNASRIGTPVPPGHHEDVHGSTASLTSTSSSIWTSVDEKQAIEIRKLRLELETARETIVSLTTQLNVNALMSKTYEQNIEGLTQRLRQLTTIIDQKESELCELRALKNVSLLTDGCGSSGLQTIPDCVSVNSTFHRRASNSASLPHDARSAGLKYLPVLTRHISCESVNSLNSQSSSCSMGSQQSATLYSETKKKKKNWIRSSFSKAFSRKKNKPGSLGEADSLSLQSDNSANDSIAIAVENQTTLAAKSSPSEGSPVASEVNVTELEEKLREADRHLTDLRLDSLASIQHVEQLQETISCLEQKVATLKAENKTLQRRLLEQGTSPTTTAATTATNGQNQKRFNDLMRHGSLRSTSLGTSVPSSCSTDGLSRQNVSASHEMSSPKLLQRFSLVDAMASDASCDQLRRVTVFVTSDSSGGESTKTEEESMTEKSRQIGILMLSEQTGWQDLDMRLCNLFVEHIHILDPETGLGLDEKSIASYRLGSQERIPNSKKPDIFPSKVLTTTNASIKIRLRDWQEDCVDFLAFDTLVPKPLLIQYVSLLTENRRLLFCGPNLSGKTFLAKKLARHLVLRKEKKLSSVSIAHFTVDGKSSKELEQYLSNIVSHCEQGSDRLPSVIVIDNLHLADNLSKAFSGFFSLSSWSCVSPYLIGTMTQSRAASITCLQFHQNFRWVLFGLTEEPVKSFLARYLHRQWEEKRFRHSGNEDGDCGLLRVVDWMPKVWQHVNRFVASVCCPDKCIGPGIFLSCPMDVDKARTWFVDLWNFSIGPYLLQLLKDSSIQSGNNRTSREDPTDWVLETSPWENSRRKGSCNFPLSRLFPQGDSAISREQHQALSPAAKQILPNSSNHSDPLLDMLLHLQVTACYTDSSATPTNNVPKNRFMGLNAASSKISANSNSLHSAAS